MTCVFYGSVDTRLARILRTIGPPPVSASFGVRKAVSARATTDGRVSSRGLNCSNKQK
jgi:hypothetical protein